MGEVFEAEDQLARERVAIKTVLTEMAWDESSHRQLQKEVHLARRVSHANVCRIHESFVHHFGVAGAESQIPVLSMELLSGVSLSADLRENKPRDEASVRSIAGPLADALAAAHRVGVVHGDFKPANIMLVPGTNGIRPVVTDFGLARGLADAGPWIQALRSFIAGTPAYMAPEQFEIGDPTPATDVYAFGLVLFELIAGAPAFPAARTLREAKAQASLAPPALRSVATGVNSQLERVVNRCLEKDPALRYLSGVELRAALEDTRAVTRRSALLVAAGLIVGAGGLASMELGRRQFRPKPNQRSIAVLPFKNTANESDMDYLVDGLTGEVRRCVGRIPGLRVAAPESSQIANSAEISFTALGKQLSVTHVLTGAVRTASDRFRARVQVFETLSSLPILDRVFESAARTALSLEIEIAAAVADVLQLRFSESERKSAAQGETLLPEAHRLFLQGNHAMQSRTAPDTEHAGAYYLAALRLDPAFALAWAALANQRQALSGHPGYLFNELVPEAERYALKARELAPDLPEALSEVGRVEERYRRNWHEAERLFQDAVRINPNFIDGLNHLSGVHSVLHRHDEAISEALRAIALDPLSVSAQNNYAYVLRNARRFSEALSGVEKAITMNPDFSLAYVLAADICNCLGNCSRARETLRGAIGRFGDEPIFRGYLAIAIARCGDSATASEMAAKLEQDWKDKPFYPSVMADVFCGLGDREKMFHWLDVAIREHDAEIASVAVDPSYDRFRAETRFQDVLRLLNLEDKAT
jgi:serine/threonine-protein kinase